MQPSPLEIRQHQTDINARFETEEASRMRVSKSLKQIQFPLYNGFLCFKTVLLFIQTYIYIGVEVAIVMSVLCSKEYLSKSIPTNYPSLSSSFLLQKSTRQQIFNLDAFGIILQCRGL